VTERTLGDSMDYSDWRAQKIDWMSEDDATKVSAPWPADVDGTRLVALQEQRIRLFNVKFDTQSQRGPVFLQY